MYYNPSAIMCPAYVYPEAITSVEMNHGFGSVMTE